jgi:hypothetical protein
MNQLTGNLTALANSRRLTHRQTWAYFGNGLIAACVKSGTGSVKALPGIAIAGLTFGSLKAFCWTAILAFASGVLSEAIIYLNANPLPPVFHVGPDAAAQQENVTR